MPGDLAQDRLLFAPTPKPIAFGLLDGRVIETELYSFMDLPAKQSITVALIEDEMKADTSGGWPALVGYLQRLVALLCPHLDPALIEQIAPRHLQAAIAASHGVALPPEGAGGEASPSPSAPSTTPSPSASTGAPSMSRT